MPIKPVGSKIGKVSKSEQDRRDEANFMAGMLSWDEVKNIATNNGFIGDVTKPGEIIRYLAFRVYQHKQLRRG